MAGFFADSNVNLKTFESKVCKAPIERSLMWLLDQNFCSSNIKGRKKWAVQL